MQDQFSPTPEKKSGYKQSKSKDQTLINTTPAKIYNQLQQFEKPQQPIFETNRQVEKTKDRTQSLSQEKIQQKEERDLQPQNIQFTLKPQTGQGFEEILEKAQRPIFQNQRFVQKRQAKIFRIYQQSIEEQEEIVSKSQLYPQIQVQNAKSKRAKPEQKQKKPTKPKKIQNQLKPKSCQDSDGSEIDINKEKQLTWQTIYKRQYQKHKPTIEKLINKPSLLGSKVPANIQVQFAKMLQTHFVEGQKLRKKTKEITARLAQVLNYLCSQLKDGLTEQQMEEYEHALKEYRRQYLQKEGRAQRAIEVKKYLSYFGETPFSIQKALKLDFFSYFMQTNRQYKQYYGANVPDKIIATRFVSVVLGFGMPIILELIDFNKSMASALSYQHRQFFQDFITVCLLIEIKHRSQVAKERGQPQQSQRQLQLFEAQKREQAKLQKKDSSMKYTYNFSWIAFIPYGHDIKTINIGQRIQIFQFLKKLSNEPSFFEQRRQFLIIKRKFNVPFNTLYEILYSLQTKQQSYLKQFEPELNFKQSIKKIQWYFYKDCSHLPNTLTRLTRCPIDLYYLQKKDNIIQRQIFRLFIQRMKILSQVISTQVKVEKALRKCDFVYIHRFQYSYNLLKSIFAAEKNHKDNDLCCSLIIAVHLNRILFTCFIKEQIRIERYCNVLKDIFADRVKELTPFSVVIYEFSVLKGWKDWKYCRHLTSFFFKKYEALLYISNSPEHFEIHFAIDLHIRNWFRENSQAINKSNFYALLQQKIAKASDIINDYPFDCEDQDQIPS